MIDADDYVATEKECLLDLMDPPSDRAERTDPPRSLVAAWPRLMSITIAAEYLGLSESTVRKRLDLVPGLRRWGRRIVVDRHVLDRMIDESGSMDLWRAGGEATSRKKS